MTKLTTGKKLPLPPLLTVGDSNWMSRTEKKTIDKLCHGKVGQSFKILASQKSLSDIVGLQTRDRCPNVAEETWVTVQAARCSDIFIVLEVFCSAFPAYSDNIISFLCLS